MRKLGIKNNLPNYTLDVDGDINCSGNFLVNGTPISSGHLSVVFLDEQMFNKW